MTRVGIFTDNDFDKVNGVTTTLRALVDHAPEDVGLRIYTASRTAVARANYVALRAPALPVPFYDGMAMYLPRFSAFLRAARRDDIELVHYTTPGPMGLVAQYVAARLGLPMVGTFHTQLAEYTTLLSGSPMLGRLMAQYLRWPYGRCTRVFAPSHATRDLLVAARIAPGKIDICSRGVDAARFDPRLRSQETRRAWGVDERTPVILYVGRLSAEKNLRLLPALVAALDARGARYRLVLVGEGPLVDDLSRRLPRAIFTGLLPQEAVATAMASADVFLFPSRTDTLGNVVLEAQASGLPVLVSNAGGPQENMLHGVSGFVCTPGHGADGFTARLLWLLEDRTRRLAFGAAAREYARHRTWADALRPLYQAWRDIASSARACAPRVVRTGLEAQ